MENAEEQIINSIELWSKQHKNLVIGIDGYSGAGKTTLLKQLAGKHNFIKPVFMDDFVSTANTKENLSLLDENNFTNLELIWSPMDGIKKLRNVITNFKLRGKKGKVLIVEGIFLFLPEVVDSLLDKRIYLDCDKSEADKKRIQREKERWGEKYLPETDPNSFTKYFKIAYKKYEGITNPKTKADLILEP